MKTGSRPTVIGIIEQLYGKGGIRDDEATAAQSQTFDSSVKKADGKLRVVEPIEMRGLSWPFCLDDVRIQKKDKAHLRNGMMMQFQIGFRGHRNNQFAKKIHPLNPARYQCSVVRAPTPRATGHAFMVSMDLTLNPVKISANSYNELQLRQPPSPGDRCSVDIPWSEILQATRENRIPIGDIISLERKCTLPETHTRQPERISSYTKLHTPKESNQFRELEAKLKDRRGQASSTKRNPSLRKAQSIEPYQSHEEFSTCSQYFDNYRFVDHRRTTQPPMASYQSYFTRFHNQLSIVYSNVHFGMGWFQ